MIRRRAMYRCASPADPPTNFLIFTALLDGLLITVKATSYVDSPLSLEYSINNGRSWRSISFTSDGTTVPVTINRGKHLLFKGTSSLESAARVNFSGNKNHNVSGNPFSIIYNGKSGQLYEGIFTNLFGADLYLVSAENLILDSDVLSKSCYKNMFHDCKSLTKGPALPATTLAEECYSSMFHDCDNLINAPELPATTLAKSCYETMFSNCHSLINIPELPATTLTERCYYMMFSACNSIVESLELKATTLAKNCYGYMFSGSAIQTAPDLPATVLAEGCYRCMFNGCYNLTKAPILPATGLVTNCYDCMFNECTKLDSVTAMFVTTPGDDYTYNWLRRVKSSGTFIKNINATWNVRGDNGVPSGWTTQSINPVELQT